MRNTPAAATLLALALLVGAPGCGDESAGHASPTVTSTPAPSATSSASPTDAPAPSRTLVPEASVPPFPADTRPADGGPGSGNGLGLTGVRTAHQPGYDRVVFDLAGDGTPGWWVGYARSPRADGSGEVIPLEGTAFLAVALHAMGYTDDTGIPQFGDNTTRIPGAGTQGVAEIYPGGFFEGDQLAYIGLTGTKRPFRVFALTDPTRLVVDVRNR